MEWTPQERKFLRSLSHPDKIQDYLNGLTYNPDDSCLSPRWVMITGEGHCLEGALLAASALEFQGYPPLLIDFQAHADDHHVIIVYKASTGWGSISKSNTTLLAGRRPFYRSVHELVMSYFDFYFNTKRQLALYAYSDPINLKLYDDLNWRTSDDNLMEMGMSFSDHPHFELIDLKNLRKLRPVDKRLADACFLGADPDGLYGA